jgi:phosphocarrier protein
VVHRVIRLKNRFSLHARTAALLVKTASRFKSNIKLASLDNSKQTDGKSILGVMQLAGTAPETELQVIAEGEDEEAAMAEILRLVEEDFEGGK